MAIGPLHNGDDGDNGIISLDAGAQVMTSTGGGGL